MSQRLPLSDGFADILVKAGLGDLITYTESPSYHYYRAKKRAFQWYEKRVKDNLKKAKKAEAEAFGGSE